MTIENNVFAALAGQSTHAEEDYLTECFALLIRNLLVREPATGLEVLNLLSRLRSS